MEITGWIKNYGWGQKGIESCVARLAMANDPDFTLNEDETYAEMWMGTHVCGVSVVKETGETLDRVLKKDLPYLFKVLSIKKPLSIQVHPNKCEAERLHKDYPDIYKDDNHKPELAIALTPFIALVGFRPVEDIRDFFDEFQPLTNLIGQDAADQLHQSPNNETLRMCYEKVMRANDASIAKCIKDIAKQYKKELAEDDLLDVFNKANDNFPGDVGVLSVFFLNVVRLQPGQAIYLGANEIHAYMDGECVECMACSDNVIRAGLTPKFKDIEQLLASVNFRGQPADHQLFMPYRIDEFIQVFAPPVDDFAVIHIAIKHKVETYKLQIKPYASILLVLEGSRLLLLNTSNGRKEIVLTRGSIVYIPAEAAPEIEFQAAEDCGEDFLAYIATYNYFNTP